MRLIPRRLLAVDSAGEQALEASGPGVYDLGPLSIELNEGSDGFVSYAWSLANRGDATVRVRAVSLVFEVDSPTEPLRFFRHGYQSWSPTGVATYGIDTDPSTKADFEFLQAVHHADQRRARDDELRSEWVTLLADAAADLILAGFEAGHDHDGTWRLRRGERGKIELSAEAFLGDVALEPGERRSLHSIVIDDTEGNASAADALTRWARQVGTRNHARVHAPYQVGWCSWYHYFHDITEAAFHDNLARARDWPFSVFQLDDGFQAAIGDWLDTNEKFPSGLPAIAEAVSAAGLIPGLWIAPFLAAPGSRVATEHPEWMARFDESGRPLWAWWNPPWGGTEGGMMHALDTSNPEVLDHLEGLARALVQMGFRYLKLDFTFAPTFDGVWADPSMTPAQRVRAGYEAIRRGAGDDTFILGCGVPLSHVLGVVDGNRIGQDVAPLWSLDPSAEVIPGYLGVQPATAHAYANTLARSFMHRQLWLNDPDCVMLRTSATDLSPDAARTWVNTVAVSGGMALVSDDLELLGPDARSLLDDLLTIGQQTDKAARRGAPPQCLDLMESRVPRTLFGAGYRLTTDPVSGSSTLIPPNS